MSDDTRLWKVMGMVRSGFSERSVLVRSKTRQGAEATGKYWLRIFGVRCRRVLASEWQPERDRDLRGWIQPVEKPAP